MKDRLKNNIGLKIVALLFATLLWLFVVNEENPVMINKFVVPVEVGHGDVITNKGQSYQIMEETKSVTVTVKATRRDLEEITSEKIKAVADLRERQADSKEGGDSVIYSVPVRVTINGCKYIEAYANPRNVQIKTENNENKTFPITPKVSGNMKENYSIGKLTAEPQSIDVSGPKSSVSRISKVVAKADVTGLSQDATLPAELIFYDAADNVIDPSLMSHNLQDSSVSVNVQVLEMKNVEVKFDTSEIMAEQGYTFTGITFEPQTITVVGRKKDLDALNYIEVGSGALRQESLSKKTEVVVDITDYLPEGIQIAEGATNNIVVKLMVEKNGIKTIQIPVNSVKVNNLEESLALTYGPEQELELQFEGQDELLEKIEMEQIVASIDLKDFKEEGTYDISVQVAGLPEGIRMLPGKTIKVVLKKK